MNDSLRFWLGWALAFALMLVVLVIGLSRWNLNTYTQLVSERLVLLAELRRGAVEEYFATADAELRFWSTSEMIIEAQQRFLEIHSDQPGSAAAMLVASVDDSDTASGQLLNLSDTEGTGEFVELHSSLHPRARLFVLQRGYYDLFLISPQGDVIYSVEKEADFATNLQTGPFKNSGLAEVFIKARDEQANRTIVVSEMQRYEPSGNAPAMFMATALHDGAGEFIGVLAFQLPTDRILSIMAYTSGMGESGETYLVGGDLLMRSDSRFSEESTVLSQRVDTPTVARALKGEQGAAFIEDYRGVEVLSTFVPVEVGDARWAVMAEIDRDELGVIAAERRPNFSGALLLIYGLSLWSVWYWRGRTLPEDNEELAQMDFPEGNNSDLLS